MEHLNNQLLNESIPETSEFGQSSIHILNGSTNQVATKTIQIPSKGIPVYGVWFSNCA